MGNLFSSSNNSTPAPSASYTVTPTNTSNDSNNDGNRGVKENGFHGRR